MLYEDLLKPILFRLDPEEAHERVTALLCAAQALPFGPALVREVFGKPPAGLEVSLWGLRFPNPLGLAAGFDKDCRLVRILPSLGFGFIEVGSVTLRPQPGNPRPRISRIPEASALINRLGFNSAGAKAAAESLKALGRPGVPLGINLGLNADCPPGRAPEEYAEAFSILEPYGDYFAVNVSSPNTKGLRDLQQSQYLAAILASIQAKNRGSKPVLIKLSPDLAEGDLQAIIEPVRSFAAGVIVSNTTISRAGVAEAYRDLPGGLSGAPLKDLSTNMIRRVRRITEGRLPIIGVGGVSFGDDVWDIEDGEAFRARICTGHG